MYKVSKVTWWTLKTEMSTCWNRAIIQTHYASLVARQDANSNGPAKMQFPGWSSNYFRSTRYAQFFFFAISIAVPKALLTSLVFVMYFFVAKQSLTPCFALLQPGQYRIQLSKKNHPFLLFKNWAHKNWICPIFVKLNKSGGSAPLSRKRSIVYLLKTLMKKIGWSW